MEKRIFDVTQKVPIINPTSILTTSACSGMAISKVPAEQCGERGAVKTASMGVAPTNSQLYLKRVNSATVAPEFGIT